MMHRRLAIPILLALSAAIYVGTAGWPALLDSSDSAHAVAAREMAETGRVYVNHPVIPGQPSLAELLARKNQAKPAPSASAGGSLPPAPPKQG
jgi:hypothetical protein